MNKSLEIPLAYLGDGCSNSYSTDTQILKIICENKRPHLVKELLGK